MLKSQSTVTKYIVKQPNMDLCKETVQIPGMWIAKGGGSRRDLTWQERGRRWQQQKRRRDGRYGEKEAEDYQENKTQNNVATKLSLLYIVYCPFSH